MTEVALVAVIAVLALVDASLFHLVSRTNRELRDTNAELLRAVIAKDPVHTNNVVKIEKEYRRPPEARVAAEIDTILAGMGDAHQMPVGLNGE